MLIYVVNSLEMQIMGGLKMKNKSLTMLLILTLILTALTSCSTTDDLNGNTDNKTSTENEKSSEKVETVSKDNEPKEKDSQLSIDEEVVFNEKDIRITLKSFESGGLFGPEFKLLIDNDSDKNITVQVRNMSINNIMIDPIFSTDVMSGKKANDGITIMSRDLELFGIETIKEVEFVFHIFDSDEWETIVDSEVIKIVVKGAEDYVQIFQEDGELIYDGDFRIIAKNLSGPDFGMIGLDLFLENNSDRYVTIQTRDLSINGFMIDGIFSCDITPGKKAFDDIAFMESDLLDNGIEKIEEIEFSFHIFDGESWDTIEDTPTIKINF
ncbi:MAG: hypothetical protein GX666_03645 [Tissierellia bacterium]|nr:hypothetical protein [Tissierellia bacterium]